MISALAVANRNRWLAIPALVGSVASYFSFSLYQYIDQFSFVIKNKSVITRFRALSIKHRLCLLKWRRSSRALQCVIIDHAQKGNTVNTIQILKLKRSFIPLNATEVPRVIYREININNNNLRLDGFGIPEHVDRPFFAQGVLD